MQKKDAWVLGVVWLVCRVLLFSAWPVPDMLNDQLSQESRFAQMSSQDVQDSPQLDQFKAETESLYEDLFGVEDEEGEEDEREGSLPQDDELDEEDARTQENEPDEEEDPDPLVHN